MKMTIPSCWVWLRNLEGLVLGGVSLSGVLTAINMLLTTLVRQPCRKLHRTALAAARAANRRARKYIRLRISAILRLMMKEKDVTNHDEDGESIL